MREIKFRAWDKEYVKMIVNIEAINFSHHVIIWDDSNSSKEYHNVELMQYTGLKDKNGVEIYEGDIVRVDSFGEETIHEVKYMLNWDYPAFDLVPFWEEEANSLSSLMVGDGGTIEVIGNIHENQELLK